EHPESVAWPAKLSELVEHARNFSELMQGAQLLYNLILAEQIEQQEYVSRYREQFAQWTVLIHSRRGVFASWGRDRFWKLVRSGNHRIRELTRKFIDNWLDLASAGNPARL